MQHPLEFVAGQNRKPLFFVFFALTIILFAVFRVLDEPLRTNGVPNGIVSFELAGTPQQAQTIIDLWSGRTTIYTDGENSDAVTTPPGELFSYQVVPMLNAAFGLGLDFLFMPVYALTLAFGTLLAAHRHAGWVKSLNVLAGWGAFTAAVFDAVENFALFQVLLGAYESSYPSIAASCATIKFGLLIFGLLVVLVGSVLPKK